MQITCILYSLEDIQKIDNVWKALFYQYMLETLFDKH